MERTVLGIDQGTTRTKAILFDAAARPLIESARDVPLSYPRPGWVELDPDLLIKSVVDATRDVLARSTADVEVLGLDNQGETVVAWDQRDGRPIYNAIVWQDRRTDAECERLKASGEAELIRARTGLPVDPYFSATKIRWILDNVPGARDLANRGDLLAGTTDSWMLWHLTGRHLTDESTASRTMLYNPRTRVWDPEILRVLDIPQSILPAIQPTRSDFGTVPAETFGHPLHVASSLVDQQAALFGQACFSPGDTKVTYGTGAFILQNAGGDFPPAEHGVIPTVAWSASNHVTFALDGGIYSAGAVVQWLEEGLGIIASVAESSAVAESVPDNGGVYFVPALTGLAAPYWDSYARGTIVGLTRGAGRGHIVRAALEGIAFRTRDVVIAMAADSRYPLTDIKVDGGASANSFLMQFLADILGVEVRVSAVAEATALGAAMMAGLAEGVWRDETELRGLWREGKRYTPRSVPNLDSLLENWTRAVERARGWAATEATPE